MTTDVALPPDLQSPASLADRTSRQAARHRWERPALLVLLGATAVLYLWGLGASGWANSFYSAAAQAGSASWKAFFFGSSDAANAITVDKTPLALWPMALSVRLFGLSSWSILVPQAMEGVAAVALLHATVRRTTGSAVAGLVAGTVLALTPVAVLMFRFNNPDALLVLLLVGAATAALRAVEATHARDAEVRRRALRWLVLAGALVGLAFLAKMLQAFLVLPALTAAYLIGAALPWRRRFTHLLAAGGAMVLAGGWWVAIVSLWPAASRPYIGGSQHNSVLELTLGYNGFGRLTGDETGSVGGGPAGAGSRWGQTGLLRLFEGEIGGQVAWLLPAALVLGIAAWWLARHQPLRRAAVSLWLGWLVVTALTFSLMAGIFHSYYTVALAPAIGALVGIGVVTLWERRESLAVRVVLALTTLGSALLGWHLLGQAVGYLPWLRWLVLLGGVVGAVALAGVSLLPGRTALVAAGVALATVLAGPTAYAVTTAATPHTGSLPTAGPAVRNVFGGGGFGGRGPRMQAGAPPTGRFQPPTGFPGPGGQGQVPGGRSQGGQAPFTPGARGGGAPGGGLLDGSVSPAGVTRLLQQDADSYTWAAAAVGSNNASGYQLASEEPVMAIGGFNGSDPSPTLAQFKQYVAAGKIHWFIAGGGNGAGGGRMGPGGASSNAIATWVSDNFEATTVSDVTLYDLSGGAR